MDNRGSSSKVSMPNNNFPQFDPESNDTAMLQNDLIKSPSLASSSSSFQNANKIVSQKRPNSTPDYLTTTRKTGLYLRSHSQNEISKDKLKNFDSKQITKRIHCDGFIKNLPLSVPVIKENENFTATDFQTSSFPRSLSYSSETILHHERKERAVTIPSFKSDTVFKEKCFAGGNSSMSSENDPSVVSSLQDMQIFPEHVYEEIDEDDYQDTVKYPEIDVSSKNKHVNDNKTFENKTEKKEKQSYKDHQSRMMGTEKSACKIKIEMYDKENKDDDLWKNYIERPLLPLKPLQKQRSMSCTNLVQTIKGLSKRKISAISRHSSPGNHTTNILFPEHMLTKKELSTSQVNISSKKTDFTTPTYLPLREDETEDYLEASVQTVRQPLLSNYAWFHSVNAKEASKRLLKMQQNGAFLIRPASNPTGEVLHTLCVVFSRCVYNFHVRSLKSGRITLGRKIDDHTQTFSSLLDLIKYHQTAPISINLTENNEVAYVYLLITPSK